MSNRDNGHVQEKNMNLVLKGEQLRRAQALTGHHGLVRYRALSRKALAVLWEQTFGAPGK